MEAAASAAEPGVAEHPAELEGPQGLMAALARRLADAGTGRAAHGDAMRAAGQAHEQGRDGQGGLHGSQSR